MQAHSATAFPKVYSASPKPSQSSVAPGVASTQEDIPTEEVTLSAAATTTEEKKSSGGKLAKMAGLVALGAAALGASGCAVTTGGFDYYGGYHQTTVGVTPDGTIYSNSSGHGVHGSYQEHEAIGPNGWHRSETHNDNWGNHHHESEGVHNGHYHYDHHHGHNHPWWGW